MANYTYTVPDKYANKTIRDIHGDLLNSGLGTGFGSLGTISSFLGIPENQRLQAGQTLTANIPDQYVGSSSEWTGLNTAFQPYVKPSAPAPVTAPVQTPQAFQQEERDRLGEFTDKLGGVDEQLESVRQALGIPQAYQTFSKAGDTARDIAARVEDLPGVLTESARGKDISANQLERMIASQIGELQPSLTGAARGLESSQAGLSNLLSQYGVETANIFTPLEIESGLLGQSISEEFGLFKTQITAALDRELEQMRQTGATDRANIERATRLAEIEQANDEGAFVDLGDRYALVTPFSGQELSSFSKGLAPKLTTLSDEQSGGTWKLT